MFNNNFNYESQEFSPDVSQQKSGPTNCYAFIQWQYVLATKGTEVLIHATTAMNLKNMVRERSPIQEYMLMYKLVAETYHLDYSIQQSYHLEWKGR